MISGLYGYQNDTKDNSTTSDGPRTFSLTELSLMYTEIVIAIIGIIGNFLCLIVLLHSSQRHQVKTPYSIVLAISDILLLSFTVLTSRLWRITGFAVPGAMGWCNIRLFIGCSAITVSGHAVALFTVNRAISVCKPWKLKSLMPTRTVLILLCLICLVSLGLHVPYLFGLKPVAKCVANRDHAWVVDDYRPILQLTYMGCVPDAIIVLGNMIIVKRLYHIRRNVPQRITVGGDAYAPVLGTCVALGVFHITTRLPLMVILTYELATRTSVAHPIYRSCLLLTTVNHAGNFVLYIMMSPSFRQTLKALLTWGFQTHRRKTAQISEM